MPYPMNNQQTQGEYVTATEAVLSPPKESFGMIVTNASIYFQIAGALENSPSRAAAYGLEVFAPPGRYSFEPSDSPTGKIAKIRVRSNDPALPARVTIQ